MTSELLARFPMDKELLQEFRNRTLSELEKETELYYQYDINRFKNDDLYAHKFLAHQHFLKVDKKNLLDKSTEMVKENFKWRKELGVQEIKREDLPNEMFDRKSSIMLKEDKQGRTVVLIQVKKLRKTRPGEKELLHKFMIYWMENIYQRNDLGITIILDCDQAGLSNVNMDMLEFNNFIFRYHYPCFLGYFLVFNMPWIFEAIWNFIKRFLPQAGIDKVKFVDKKTIVEYIDADKLPECLGGTDPSEFQYDESLKDLPSVFLEKADSNMVQSFNTVSLRD